MSTIFINSFLQAADPWYLSGGAPLFAFQPKGAASQADSYLDLSSNGWDLTAGASPPSWNAGIGWTFSGEAAGNRLYNTSFTALGTTARTVAVRWTPIDNSIANIINLGATDATSLAAFALTPEIAIRIQGGNAVWSVSDTTDQVIIVTALAAGSTGDLICYKNNIALTRTGLSNSAYDTAIGLQIGGVVSAAGNGPVIEGDVVAIAAWDHVLSEGERAAVYAGMAAL